MAKKYYLVILAVLMSLLFVGCGVPQEDYDSLLSEKVSLETELTSAQNQLQSAQSQLQSTQDQLQSTQSDLQSAQDEPESARADLKSTQSELASTKSDLTSSNWQVDAQRQKMDEAKTFAEMLSTLFVPAFEGKTINEFQLLSDWLESVKAIDDPEVQRLFQRVLDSEGGTQELLDFYVYVFKTLPQVLE